MSITATRTLQRCRTYDALLPREVARMTREARGIPARISDEAFGVRTTQQPRTDHARVAHKFGRRQTQCTNPARSPRRSRTIPATLLLVSAAALLTGCASGAASSVDGTYVKVAETSGISSAWVIDGDSARFIAPGCDIDEQRDAKVISEDLTRITNPDTGENYTITWYEDRSGFVWTGHGDFIRADSEIGKGAVERWETKCGKEWPS